MSSIRNLVRHARTVFVRLSRQNRLGMVVVGTSGLILSAQLVKPTQDSKPKSELKNESLSTDKLVQNASNLATESACTLHFQASMAYMEALQQYTEVVGQLVTCLVFAVKDTSGAMMSDDQLWEKIIAARHDVNEWKRLKTERQHTMLNAEKLVGLAAEISFGAGSHYSAISANERLLSVKTRLSTLEKNAEVVEKKLADAEAKMIKITGQNRTGAKG